MMTSTQGGAVRRAVRQPAYRPAAAVAIGCFLLAGCNGPEYELAPVSGRVTMDGKPLAEVIVRFQPIAERSDQPNPGPGSFGTTDQDGRYRLRTIKPDAEGAVVGTHRVYLSSKPPPQDPADDRAPVFKEIIPSKWRDGSQTFTVPAGGTTQADFQLSRR